MEAVWRSFHDRSRNETNEGNSPTFNSDRRKGSSVSDGLFQSFQLLFEEDEATACPIREETDWIQRDLSLRSAPGVPGALCAVAIKHVFCKWPAFEL